jgi:Flp pilus assembly protein TadG
MRNQGVSNRRRETGQSLVETVLLMPVLLLLVLNAINFGYFFLVALNLTSASRSGVGYSIQGSSTPSAIALPAAGPSTNTLSVSYLTYRDMTGALGTPTASGSLQVCSQSVGLGSAGTTSEKALCSTFGPAASFPTPASDPELNSGSTAPAFVLNRVDVTYRFSPLIPGAVFNLTLLAAPICTTSAGTFTCAFHRQASMRAM